jgi:hypothetical protein
LYWLAVSMMLVVVLGLFIAALVPATNAATKRFTALA